MNVFKLLFNKGKIRDILQNLYNGIYKVNEVLKTLKIEKYQKTIDKVVQIDEKVLTILAFVIKILGGTVEPVVMQTITKSTLDDVLTELNKIEIS